MSPAPGARGAALALLLLLATLVSPPPVAAHSLGGRLESPLPLAVYLVGAALAVALSFAFVVLRELRTRPSTETRTVEVPPWLVTIARAIGLLGWLWVLAQTLIGGSSAAEVAPLFLWVYVWVGAAIISGLFAPVWSWLDPIATLHDLLAAAGRRVGVGGWTAVPYPERLDRWPAVAGLALFIWLELAAPAVPVGPVLLGYTLIQLVLMSQFGRDAWLERGETLHVWFGTLNRLAPYAHAGAVGARTLRRRPFGAGLLEGDWSPALLVLVTLGTGAILYDGLSQTEPWFAAFGAPGVAGATALLAISLAALVALVTLVARLVGVAALAAGLVPIAFGYLIAHYLTFLVGDGVRILYAISDPFQLGWDLIGVSFIHDLGDLSWLPAGPVWAVQLSAVVGGHMVGAWAGHLVAAETLVDERALRWRQLPLAALMVLLTATTLWSLGQAIVVDPGAPGVAAR